MGKHLRYLFLFITFICFGVKSEFEAIAQPANDNCAGATTLTIGQLLCTYATFSNASATNSTDPSPGCANYSGKDVWFKVTVPASGNLTFDMLEGAITDAGMAVYSGTCGSLTLLACDDNSSNNGLMPSITQTGLTAGSTIYIRVWEYGGEVTGTFGICVMDNVPVSTCGQTCTGPPPTNDDCIGAYNLGTLPAPPSCSGGASGGAGATITAPAGFSNNTCATAGNPYTAITNCFVGGPQDNPSTDVWYRFTATSTDLVVSISNSLQNTNFALYSGTCSNLVGVGCAQGTGAFTYTFSPLSSGATYYLQVSGGTPNDRCAFTLSMHNDRNCTYCIQESSLTATPPPGTGAAPPGTYLAGTTVQFCYTISQYNTSGAVNVNWMHGVVPVLGSGWDASTLQPVSTPTACNAAFPNAWGWYNSVTGTGGSSAQVGPVGPGFFFNGTSGCSSPCSLTDGNPGNNWGDLGTCSRTFCWEVTANPNNLCNASDDLNMTVIVYADAQTGSWTQPGCSQDPDYPFYADNNCCSLQATVGGGGLGCPGSIVPVQLSLNDDLYPNGPWNITYTINGASPTTLTGVTTNPITINAIVPTSGQQIYAISAASNPDCSGGGSGTAAVNAIPLPVALAGGGGTVCAGNPNPNVTITCTGIGPWTVTYTHTPPGGVAVATTVTTSTPLITIANAPAGTYQVTSVASNAAGLNCSGTPIGSATVTVINIPVANAGTDQTVCILNTNLAGNAVTAPVTGTWTQVSGPGTSSFSPNANAANATVTVTAPGTYVYRWTLAQGSCNNNDQVQVVFSNLAPNAGPDQAAVCGLTATLAGNAAGSGTTGQWTQIAGPGTASFSNANSATSTATVTLPGTYQFQWQFNNGTCSNSDLVDITYLNPIAAAGNDQPTACGLTTNLSATPVTAPTIGTWTQVSGPGTSSFANANAANSAVTASVVGTYVYQWTVVQSGCSVNDQVQVVYIQAAANAGPDPNAVCGLTTTLAATPATAPFSGTWTQTAGPGTASFSSAASATANVTVSQAGNYTFTWTTASGTCSAQDAVNITFNAAPTATISGGGAICNNGTATANISIQLTGTAPFNFSYTNGTTSTPVTNYSGPIPFTATVSQAGTYTVTNLTDANSCTGTSSGTAQVTTVPLPTATISGTSSICSGATANLTFTLTGTPPFNVVYTDGSVNYTASGIVSGATVSVSPTATTTYTIVSVTSGGSTSCTNSGTGSATITINDGPIVDLSAVSYTCNGTNTQYQVSFTISGGTAPYTVNGTPIVGTSFTSAFQNNGTYSFNVNDAGNCGPFVVAGTYNCACTTNAGLMQNNPQDVCENQAATAAVTPGSFTLDANDIGLYVLHTNSGASLGTIVAQNSTGSFSFQAGISYNTTYYISYVVGNAIGANVDTNDPCLSVAAGVAVTFYQAPTANAGADQNLCVDNTTLSATIPPNGMVGDWTYTGPGTLTFSNLNDPTATVTAATLGSYTLTWTISNDPCTPASDNVVVSFGSQPAINLGTPTCNAAYTAFNVTFTVTGGTPPFTITPSAGTLGGTAPNYTLSNAPEGTSITLNLNDASNCTASATIPPQTCDCPFVPAPTITQGAEVCAGITPLPAITVAAAPAGQVIRWYNSATGGTSLSSSTNFVPTTPGTYYVSYFNTTTNCESTLVPVTLTQFPALNLSAQQPVCAIDLDSYSVTLNITGGVPPYNVTGTSGSVSQTGPNTYIVSSIAPGTNITVNVSDAENCSTSSAVTSPFCICPIYAAPIVNNATFCFGASPTAISVNLEPGTGVNWYNVPTGGTPLSTTNPWAPPSVGTYYAEIVDLINGCTSSRTLVNVQSSTQINATQGTSTCAPSLINYDLNVQISGGTLPYTVTEVNGLAISGSGTNFTVNDVPNGSAGNLNVSDANGCQVAFPLNAVVCDCPTIADPIVNNNDFCNGLSPTALTVTMPGGTLGVYWFSTPTGGAPFFEGASYTPSSAGTYYVEIQDTISHCASNRLPIVLSELPGLTFAESQGTCSADLLSYSVPFTISGGTPPFNVSVSIGTLNGTNGNYTVSGVPTNEIVQVTVSDANGCTLPSNQILTAPDCPCPAIPSPTLVGSSPYTFCQGGNMPTVSVTPPTADYAVFWYDVPAGGVALGAGTSFTPPYVGTFYVGLSLNINNNCSSNRISFTITENAPPTFTAGTPSCSADLSTYEVAITPTGNGPFTVMATSPATVNNSGGGVFTIQNIPSNQTADISITDNNGCTFSSIVGPQNCDCPVVAPPSGIQGNTFCAGETETAISVASPPAGYEVNWYLTLTGGTPIASNQNPYTPIGLGGGTYYAEYFNPTSGCSSQRVAVVLTEGTINAPLINGIAASYCSNDNAITLSGVPTGGIFTINGVTTNTLNPAALPLGLIPITYSITDINGCPQSNNVSTQIVEPLEAPVVSCGIPTANSVTFMWTDIGATAYDLAINVNGTPSFVTGIAATTYTVTGLAPLSNVSISIIGLGTVPCGDSPIGFGNCTAADCPISTLSISGLAASYCSNTPAVTLSAVPINGTFSGPGMSGNTFTPANAGTGNIVVVYDFTDSANGCTYQTTANTTITPALTAPVVSCAGSTTNSVTFNWSDLGVASYTISYSINGNPLVTPAPVSGTTYTVTGMTVGQNVTINVVAVGTPPCGNSPAGTQTCTAQDCPAVAVSINGLATQYCANAAAVSLTGTPSGGTFSGPGMSAGNTFTPANVGAATSTIVYSYTDPTTGCPYSAQLTTDISQPLAAPVVQCGNITTDNIEFVWNNTGASTYNVSISINGGTPITNAGISGTSYTQTGLQPGDVVDISVIANGNMPCGNSPAGTTTCTTNNCPTVALSISNLAPNYCATDAPIVLNAIPSGGTLSGPGINGNTFNPASVPVGSTVNINYDYTDPTTGCNYQDTFTTQIAAPLATPTVTCNNSTTNSITFEWVDIGAPNGYALTISVNGSAATNQTVFTNTYTQSGLVANDQVTISVIGLGDAICGDSPAATTTCIAADCIPTTLTISGLATQYCADNPTVTLTATPPGGTFSGPGVSGNNFSPITAGITDVSIIYSYTDPATGCLYQETASTQVNEPLNTPVVQCSNTTANSVEFTWTNLGVAQYELTITINGGPAQAPIMTANNTYTITGLNQGDNVTISVVAISTSICGNSNPGTSNCSASSCPPVNTGIDNLPAQLCINSPSIELVGTPAGGVFSGDGVSGGFINPGTLTTNPAAIVTYTYTDAASGCVYTATASTAISEPLPAPNVQCGTPTTNSVTFTWNDVGAAQYAVTATINGVPQPQQTVLSTAYVVTPLNEGDDVAIEVIPIGGAPCGNGLPGSQTCTAADCPAMTVTINNVDAQYCSDAPSFALNATPTGGDFFINSTQTNNFNPSVLPVGTNITVDYTYIDEDNNCPYTASVTTTIVDPIPTPTVNCTGSTTTSVSFGWNDEGVATYNISYTINGVLQPTDNTTGTTYTVNGLTEGDVVAISVVAAGGAPCGDSAAGTAECTAQDCPTISISIDNLDAAYCIGAATVPLTGTPAGGTFTIDGTAVTELDPAVWPVGDIEVNYNYTDPNNGCAYNTQLTIAIVGPIPAPVVTCSGSTTTSVSFDWNDFGGIDTYNISYTINSGAAQTDVVTGGVTTYTINGLSLGDEVSISVVATGSGNVCGNSSPGTAQCSAQNCPLTVTIDNVAAAYCATDSPVILQATPAGGTWAGDGVAGNAFDPSAVGTTTANITYSYTDPTNGCQYQEQVQTTIEQPIDAPTISCGNTTANSVEFVWTDAGVAQYELSYSIDGGAAINQTVSGTSYVVTGLTAGSEVVCSINVVNTGGICSNTSANTATCIATDCGPNPIQITLDSNLFCNGDAAIALTATPVGGTFGGIGVIGTQFDPTVADAGTHTITYTFTAPDGCEYTANQVVTVSAVTISTIADQTITEGTTLVLTTNAQSAAGNITYSWSDPSGIIDDITAQSPGITPIETNTYSVTATDAAGCSAVEAVTITLEAKNRVTIPTAFSPNGDGLNDVFRLRGSGVASFNMHIRNRWGQEVFKAEGSNNIDQGWDGNFNSQPSEIGVYVYYVEVVFTDGSEDLFRGNVTLVR